MATKKKPSESERVRAMRKRAVAESRDANDYFENRFRKSATGPAPKGKK